jgi:hypothetical protein
MADQRNQPDGGLKCSHCDRPVEPATGGIDEDGFLLCARCDGYFAGYQDGQGDAADALALVVRAAERGCLLPDAIADGVSTEE